MAVGLRIRSPITGATQIDERYNLPGLTSFGTVSLNTAGTGPNPSRTATVTVTGQKPKLALASAYPVNVYGPIPNGSQFTFYLQAATAFSTNVSYWIFDNATMITPPASGTVGFRLRNPDTGQLVFHSKMKPLRLVETINIDRPADGWDGSSAQNGFIDTRTVEGGRAYAVIQGSPCYRFETFDGGELIITNPEPGWKATENRSMYSAASVNGNQIKAGLFTYESFRGQAPESQPSTGQTHGNLSFWIVDVTGYGGAIPSLDYEPDPVNWGNISISTTSNVGSSQNPVGQTISGITTPITLRANISGLTGNLTGGSLQVMNYNGGSPVVMATRALSNGYVEFTATNGLHLYFVVEASTVSGARSGSCTIAVQNMSDQAKMIDTFTVTAAVDTDNSYNLSADKTPNPLAWADINETDQTQGYVVAATNTQTVSGIDAPITLRVTGANLYGSGTPFNPRSRVSAEFSLYAVVSGATGSGQISIGNAGGSQSQSFDIEVSSGQTVYFTTSFGVSANLGGASGSGGGDFTITNLSDGGAVLDTFQVSLSATSPDGDV